MEAWIIFVVLIICIVIGLGEIFDGIRWHKQYKKTRFKDHESKHLSDGKDDDIDEDSRH